MGVKKTSGGWLVDYRNENNQRKRLLFVNRESAEEYLAKEILVIKSAKRGLVPKRVTFSDYVECWLTKTKRECESRNKLNTYLWYEAHCKNHLIQFFEGKSLTDIRRKDFITFREYLENKELSPKSIRSYLTTLGTILRNAYKEELLEKDLSGLIDKPESKRHQKLKVPLTLNEVNVFLNFVEGHYKLYFAIAFYTGMRPGEILGLKHEDIDLTQNKIFIHRSFSGGNRHLTTPKSGQGRIIDIIPPLKEVIISRSMKTFGYVFEGLHITNLRNRCWKKMLKKMSLAHRKLYTTRHTFASLMLSSGESPLWVAHMMGDHIETVLQNYAVYVPNQYRKDGFALQGHHAGHFLDSAGSEIR